MKRELALDLINDFNEKDIESLAIDFEVIKMTMPNINSEIFFKKRVDSFELTVSDFYAKMKLSEIFLFQKISSYFFEDGLLNKLTIYCNVPFNDRRKDRIN